MDLRRKKEIVGWIRNNFPDSTLGMNYKDVDVDEFFCVDEITDYFYFEDLKFCGCGYRDESEKLIMSILDTFDAYHCYNFDSEHDETKIGLHDIALKILDSHGFIDHGTSIYSSFLTNKGKMYLDSLREKYSIYK